MKKIVMFFFVSLFFTGMMNCQTPNIIMTTSKVIGSSISFNLITKVANTIVQVDFGDGSKIDKTIGIVTTTVTGKLLGSQTIKIYGTGITSLDCSGGLITSLDVTKSIELTKLVCYNNQLTSLDVTNNISLTGFWCYSNQLSSLDVSNNTSLTEFWCHLNQLSSLDVTKNTALTWLICSNNQLTTLNVTMNTKLIRLSCAANRLTLATLPLQQGSWIYYSYTPQKLLLIPNIVNTGVDLDLSTQFSINGNNTGYTWKTKGGLILIEGNDYSIASGKTIFKKSQADSVYCEMTNAAFPNFTGTNVLKTTYTSVSLFTLGENLKGKGIEIYSMNKTLYVNIPNNAQISVFDMAGRLVLSKPLNNGSNNIKLKNTGFYFLKIFRNNELITRKVFIE